MNVPIRGSMLWKQAAFLVACRVLWRAMRPELPSLIWFMAILWLGILIGGVAVWWNP